MIQRWVLELNREGRIGIDTKAHTRGACPRVGGGPFDAIELRMAPNQWRLWNERGFLAGLGHEVNDCI